MAAALTLLLLLDSCEKDPEQATGGVFTIDNTLYGQVQFYAIGFSFEQGRKLKTSDVPGPDITVHARTGATGGIEGAYIDTPNLVESFALAGGFGSEAEAKTFFDGLLEIEPASYNWVLNADDVRMHQVWIFKTSEDNYVRFMIKDLVLEDGDGVAYAELTAEWLIQADGSTTFEQ
ncbi:MAG: hypothetical protein U5K32_08830 [Bacteroidales bacterium]|nr:hypothetical protein [Bacteroidales bacterium]